jgi:hypothetical protein
MTAYQFEISHKSGTVDCLTVQADGIATAWSTAERLTGSKFMSVFVRNPSAFGDPLWHPLNEARRLEKIARVLA